VKININFKMTEEITHRLKVKERLITRLIIPVVGGFLLGGFIMCGDCIARGDYEDFLVSSIISVIFWLVLSEGNSYLGNQIDRYITWLENPFKRLVVGFLVLLLFTTLASLVILYLFIEFYYKFNFFEVLMNNWYSHLKLPIGITIFVSLALHGREFLLSWRQAAINVEKLKSENIASQYESLKNQVSPHFLFNSLNALSSLVYSNQDKAVQFIRKLSEVYRYVLDHQMDEVVDLKEEMDFVKSFVFLNKIRFGENLKVSIKGFDTIKEQWMIPPLAIQMLLENCFKHNIVSKDNHLFVEILFENKKIVVKNNLNPKKITEDSSGFGLKNIKSRYGFLTESKVEITQDESSFMVVIPLLKAA